MVRQQRSRYGKKKPSRDRKRKDNRKVDVQAFAGTNFAFRNCRSKRNCFKPFRQQLHRHKGDELGRPLRSDFNAVGIDQLDACKRLHDFVRPNDGQERNRQNARNIFA